MDLSEQEHLLATAPVHLSLGTAHVIARPGETVLDAFRRIGADLRFSCRSGVCHACRVKCSSGTVPADAQHGLSAELAAQRWLLACQCIPVGSMVLQPQAAIGAAPPRALENPGATVSLGPEIGAPDPDPPLWAEIGGDTAVRRLLTAFYDKVFADPSLAPFFHGTTRERAIDKQYSFMHQCITGRKGYTGNRPRNAHHWMIVPHALFDHRQAVMIETLREHGLNDDRVARWTRFEEHFRADIVKDQAWPREIGGVLYDTESYETVRLDESTLCDHCGAEVLAGTWVRVHRRLGQVGCAACQGEHGRTEALAP